MTRLGPALGAACLLLFAGLTVAGCTTTGPVGAPQTAIAAASAGLDRAERAYRAAELAVSVAALSGMVPPDRIDAARSRLLHARTLLDVARAALVAGDVATLTRKAASADSVLDVARATLADDG